MCSLLSSIYCFEIFWLDLSALQEVSETSQKFIVLKYFDWISAHYKKWVKRHRNVFPAYLQFINLMYDYLFQTVYVINLPVYKNRRLR
jgi:hypothetical protein